MKYIGIVLVLLVAAGAVAQPGSVEPPQSYEARAQWQNPVKYGAKGDSTSAAANSVALRKAYEGIGSSPGEIRFPAGKFLLDSTVKIQKDVDLGGAGMGRTFLYIPLVATTGDTIKNGVYVLSTDHVRIHDLTIVRVGPNDTLALTSAAEDNGVYLVLSDSCVVENVEVIGFSYGIRSMGASATNIRDNLIRNCRVHGNLRHGIVLANCADNVVEGCWAYDNGKLDYGTDDSAYGVWNYNSGDVGWGITISQQSFMSDSSYNNTIRNCQVFGNRGSGITLWQDAGSTPGIAGTKIVNNSVHDNRYNGVVIARARNTVLSGNLVYNNNRANDWQGNCFAPLTYGGVGIQLEIGALRTTIAGNVIYETKAFDTLSPDYESQYAAIQVGDGSPKADSVSESATEPAPDTTVIIGNTCYNNRRYQMAIAGAGGTYTHREIDGYVVNGIGGTDTLWRTDIYLYRDGRDNLSIDSFAMPTVKLEGSAYMAAPYLSTDYLALDGSSIMAGAIYLGQNSLLEVASVEGHAGSRLTLGSGSDSAVYVYAKAFYCPTGQNPNDTNEVATQQDISDSLAAYSGGGGASALNDLADVDTTGYATNRALVWLGTGWGPGAVDWSYLTNISITDADVPNNITIDSSTASGRATTADTLGLVSAPFCTIDNDTLIWNKGATAGGMRWIWRRNDTDVVAMSYIDTETGNVSGGRHAFIIQTVSDGGTGSYIMLDSLGRFRSTELIAGEAVFVSHLKGLSATGIGGAFSQTYIGVSNPLIFDAGVKAIGNFFKTDSTDTNRCLTAAEVAATQTGFAKSADTVTVGGTVWNPETITDTVPVFYVDSVAFPFGIKVTELSIQTNLDGAYTASFHEFTSADPPVYAAGIDTLTIGASDQRAASVTFYDSDIARGAFIYLLLPSTDINWMRFTITYYRKSS